jgi:hypothetical protein
MAQSASQEAGRPYSFLHIDIESVIVGKARSLLVHTVRAAGADALLFVDQDIVVPPHTIVALMDRNVPIVGGFYIGRRMPYLPQIYTTKGTEGYDVPLSTAITTPRDIYWAIVDYDVESADLLEVDAIGAGCLMIRREVIERMASLQAVDDKQLSSILERLKAYPADVSNPKGLSADEYNLLQEHVRVMDPWFEFLTDEGEDMYFCRKARNAGYKIYCDLSVKCLHLGTVPIEEGHFLFLKPQLQHQGGSDEHLDDPATDG